MREQASSTASEMMRGLGNADAVPEGARSRRLGCGRWPFPMRPPGCRGRGVRHDHLDIRTGSLDMMILFRLFEYTDRTMTMSMALISAMVAPTKI